MNINININTDTDSNLDTDIETKSNISNKFKVINKNLNNLDNNIVNLTISHNSFKHWLDSRINTTKKILNYSDINTNDLYISNHNKIILYYNPTDYEIKQKYYNYDNKLNIYSHPNKDIQKKHDNNAIIYIGIKDNTRRFYLDNIFRKMIDICVRDNIRDPLTGDYLINKNLRNDFYKWSKKYS